MVYHPFRNLGLKFLSVAIALLLWLAVSGQAMVERSLVVPLELVNRPASLEQIDISPETVQVRVRGAAGTLADVERGGLATVLDLREARVPQQTFHLTPAKVNAPVGVEVLQVSPPSITLRFEKSKRRQISVQPDVVGQPAAGYVQGTVKVKPERIEIEGPESAVDKVIRADTDPISVAGATRPVEESVSVRINDALIRLRETETVRVVIEIKPAPAERQYPRVAVRLLNIAPRRRAEAQPAAVAVTVRGPELVVRGLQADAISLSVDVAGLGPGRYSLPVRAEPPSDLEIIRIEPSKVSIRIR